MARFPLQFQSSLLSVPILYQLPRTWVESVTINLPVSLSIIRSFSTKVFMGKFLRRLFYDAKWIHSFIRAILKAAEKNYICNTCCLFAWNKCNDNETLATVPIITHERLVNILYPKVRQFTQVNYVCSCWPSSLPCRLSSPSCRSSSPPCRPFSPPRRRYSIFWAFLLCEQKYGNSPTR